MKKAALRRIQYAKASRLVAQFHEQEARRRALAPWIDGPVLVVPADGLEPREAARRLRFGARALEEEARYRRALARELLAEAREAES